MLASMKDVLEKRVGVGTEGKPNTKLQNKSWKLLNSVSIASVTFHEDHNFMHARHSFDWSQANLH